VATGERVAKSLAPSREVLFDNRIGVLGGVFASVFSNARVGWESF